MAKKWKIDVVVHTHWDREWYFTQSRANTLFSNNMKEIMQVLNNNSQFKHFVLDGQVSVLNDYLENNVANYYKIKKLAQADKLLLGPWYSQPDTFNSIGETIIRNLEYGINIANKFNKTMRTAYLPDSFGFNINLPQIFKYFGLNNMVFWRGMKKEDNDKTLYFNWKGIDGTTIPTYCFQHGYWVFGGVFPYDKINETNYQSYTVKILQDLKPFLKTIKERSHSELNHRILLPFGGDEGPIVNQLTNVINELNLIDEEHQWSISNFANFFDKVEQPSYQIDTSLHWPYLSRIHRTIASSRYDIKQLFRQCEISLYYELEPLSIIYWQLNNDYNNQDIIDSIMKKILVTQAHDSLGTCNSDETNRDLVNRLNQALEMIKMEIAIIKKKIFHNLKLDDNSDLLCFNLSPYARSVTLDTKINSLNKMLTPVNKNFILKIKKTTALKTALEYKTYYQHQIAIKTPIMEPLSYQVFKINHHDGVLKTNNNYTNIIGDPDNHLWVHRHQIRYINNQLSLDNFINILPYDDFGDSYDFSPNPQKLTTTKISAINKITQNITSQLYHIIKLEHQVIYKNNLSQIFKITISKWFGEPYQIKVVTDNRSINTKWVINFDFASEFDLADVLASQSLALVARKDFVELDWVKKGYKEFPCPITTNDNAIKIKKFNNFTLLTKGNNEFEVANQGLALTLFRSYGYIGNEELLWRPGRPSGVHIATPDAQLQKELVFELAFSFNDDKTAKLINGWNFKSDLYYSNNPDDLDFYADRFVINFDNKATLSSALLSKIAINPNLLISSFRKLKDNLVQLRIANLTNDVIEVDLKLNAKKINFAIQDNFDQENYLFDNIKYSLTSQKFITVIFEIPTVKSEV